MGPAFELSVPLEILIGTVPLNSTIDRYLAMHQMTPPTPRNLNFNHRGASAIQDNDIRPSYCKYYIFKVLSKSSNHTIYVLLY